jgi:hypothetical protein
MRANFIDRRTIEAAFQLENKIYRISLVTKYASICGLNKTVAFGRPKVQKLTTMRFGHKRASMIAPFTVLQRRANHDYYCITKRQGEWKARR